MYLYIPLLIKVLTDAITAICPLFLCHLSSAQLHRVELERDQFRQSLEVERAHHTEELSTVQSANE